MMWKVRYLLIASVLLTLPATGALAENANVAFNNGPGRDFRGAFTLYFDNGKKHTVRSGSPVAYFHKEAGFESWIVGVSGNFKRVTKGRAGKLCSRTMRRLKNSGGNQQDVANLPRSGRF